MMWLWSLEALGSVLLLLPLAYYAYFRWAVVRRAATRVHVSARARAAAARGDSALFPAWLLAPTHGQRSPLAQLLLRAPFVPHPLAANAHVQTVVASELRSAPPLRFRRRAVRARDGERIVLDECVAADGAAVPPGRSLVLLLHGLSGSSESNYIRHCIAFAQRRCGPTAYRFVVLHARGAARGSVLRQPLFYNACFTRDLTDVGEQLGSLYPGASLRVLMTFSMGSNVASHYLAEHGDSVPFDACCAIGNPFDMHLTAERMQSFPGSLYSRMLVRGLHSFLERNASVLEHAPFDMASGLRTRTVQEFDRAVVVPLHGFADTNEYYSKASSADKMHRITIPMLAFGAADDPICHVDAHPLDSIGDNTIFATTNFGGHIAHIELNSLSAESYIDKVCVAFLQTIEQYFEHREKNA